jgi:hypothetical protein
MGLSAETLKNTCFRKSKILTSDILLEGEMSICFLVLIHLIKAITVHIDFFRSIQASLADENDIERKEENEHNDSHHNCPSSHEFDSSNLSVLPNYICRFSGRFDVHGNSMQLMMLSFLSQ